jgi:hypothetical protein
VNQRQAKTRRKICRLIEPALAMTRRMKGNRNGGIGADQKTLAGLTHPVRERFSERAPAVVLQRLNDRSEGSVVGSPCDGAVDEAARAAAARTLR